MFIVYKSLYFNFILGFYCRCLFVVGLKVICFCFIATGHGGSDGLHGYVPSLDHVVADTVSIFLLSSVCINIGS